MDFTGADGILMGATALITAILTQFFNFLHRKRQDDLKHENEEDDRVISGYQLTIAKLDTRIDVLEKAYDAMRKEHVECIVVQAELRGEIAALRKQFSLVPTPPLPSELPPPIAPPPHLRSPQITPHNQYQHLQPPNIPSHNIEPLDQK